MGLILSLQNLLANIDSFDSTLDATTVNISSNLDSTQILVDAIHDPVQVGEDKLGHKWVFS